jgi:probable HAF family extracellular repeat protein
MRSIWILSGAGCGVSTMVRLWRMCRPAYRAALSICLGPAATPGRLRSVLWTASVALVLASTMPRSARALDLGNVFTTLGEVIFGNPCEDIGDPEKYEEQLRAELHESEGDLDLKDSSVVVQGKDPTATTEGAPANVVLVIPASGPAPSSTGANSTTSGGTSINVGTIQPLGRATNPVAIFGLGVNSGGSVAAGWSGRDGNLGPHAISWTLAGGTVDLGSLPGTPALNDASFAYAMSEYADAIVGSSGSPTTFSTAFRFTTADNTMRDLGALPASPNGVSSAYGVNFDGSVVVGSSTFTSQDNSLTHAFRWVLTPGMTTGVMSDIDGNARSSSAAYAVNGDGSVVVGTQRPPGTLTQNAFIWTQATGMVILGALPGDSAAMATGVSRDGTMVVGTSNPGEVFNPFTNLAMPQDRPFFWTKATGMQDVNALANAAGLNPNGFVLQNATGISRDGRLIYGNGVDAQGNTGSYILPYCNGGSCTSSLVAAVLPASRSVQVGGAPATAFATIINTSATTLNGCSVQPPEGVAANFTYQTTDPATNALIGTANTPVSLAPNAAQSFVFGFATTAPFAPIALPLVFNCSGQFAVAPQNGLNTLLFSASTTPVPDVVALGATVSNDGILHITGASGSAAFAVATVDVGATGTITATANTGSATLPLALSLCQTDPTSGACLAAPATSVTTTIAANATPTFGIFGTASGAIAFDPANSRIFVQFTDSGGAVRGETSVAVETQ